MNNSRELTEDEVRNKFVEHCFVVLDYWENLPNKSLHEKLVGTVFSVLVTLDGESVNLPGFIVAPLPHPDDKEYNKENNENWYPQNHENQVNCDISGGLHDAFIKMDKD